MTKQKKLITVSTTRRNMLLALPVFFSIGAISPLLAATDDSPLANIERRHGGRLGLFAIDTGTHQTLAYRADERFLMCSTFKGLLAALIFSRVDVGQEQLARMIAYTKHDLIFHAPITKANIGKRAMSVNNLIQAMLEHSDNTATNLLMQSAGGPAALTKFMRHLGDNVTRSDRYETKSNQYNGQLDTTSPRAMVGSVHKILLGDVLKPESRMRLEASMIACQTGAERIRASLPKSWTVGNRSGENLTEESNDYAIVRPPDRAPLIVAIYYNAPKTSIADREASIRDAGAVFVKWANGN